MHNSELTTRQRSLRAQRFSSTESTTGLAADGATGDRLNAWNLGTKSECEIGVSAYFAANLIIGSTHDGPTRPVSE